MQDILIDSDACAGLQNQELPDLVVTDASPNSAYASAVYDGMNTRCMSRSPGIILVQDLASYNPNVPMIANQGGPPFGYSTPKCVGGKLYVPFKSPAPIYRISFEVTGKMVKEELTIDDDNWYPDECVKAAQKSSG